MKPALFHYYAPRDAEEAITLLGEHAGDDGRILAGGQSLVPMMALRLARPGSLIDINAITSFADVTSDSSSLTIGPCVRHARFHQPVVSDPLGALLSEVAEHIAHYPIRLRGTFCGSLAHADPSSEWCLVAAVLNAQVEARSTRGTRIIDAVDFFDGAMTTALEPDEMIVSVRLPLLTSGCVFGFSEFSRRAGDYAMAAALVTYRIYGGRMRDVRLAVGGAESYPRRIVDAEAVLNGARPTLEVFREASHVMAMAISPITDAQASPDFRRKLVRAMSERALEKTIKADG